MRASLIAKRGIPSESAVRNDYRVEYAIAVHVRPYQRHRRRNRNQLYQGEGGAMQ